MDAGTEQQGVTIGRRLGHNFSRYDRAASTIIHDRLLTQAAGESLRKDAGCEIGAAARLRRDNAYGFARIVLTVNRPGK